jgi:asparagine synthase (glutamine-hydrolysing)
MCGICGVIQVEGDLRPVISEETLAVMTDLMTHRGPDDRGFYRADGVALGARRLSIIDVEGGHQPMANESGEIWAVQNGELYNHAKIRDEFERDGHRFRTRCDTEVLPHLYERYGPMFPKQLRGMFGIAIWDRARRTAVLARDRLGVKPLYYARSGDLLVFASELKSVLASGLVEYDLDYAAIDAYLSLGFFPGPMTPIAGLSKLRPGHILVVEPGRVQSEQYWRYPEPEVGARLSESEYREQLVEKLEESVRMRLMSDVPLGAMLSGGLDSSLVVALMARHASEPVKTFSVGFSEAGSENELADARSIAEFYGTDHHELELSFTDTVDLENLVWYLDEPLADLSALGFLGLCELASRDVKVALCGQGADELFGGYAKHRAATIVHYWRSVPTPLQRLGTSTLGHLNHRAQRPMRTLAARDPVERLLAMSNKLDAGIRERLFIGPLRETHGEAARRAIAASLGSVDDSHPLASTLHIDGQLALVDDMLHYFDRASMAHSLEVRVPFLDHEFVEFAARVPPDLKVRRLRTKYILKEAARGIVPKEIVDKRKIGFFHRSVGGWLQAQTERSLRDYLLGPNPRYGDFLDQRVVRELVAGPKHEEDEHLLLAILMLEIWLSRSLPAVRAAAAAAEITPSERAPLPQ